MKGENLQLISEVLFPESTGIAINMMPFVMGDVLSIPEQYRKYTPIIDKCGLERNQIGKVGYLSIQENAVTERRPSQRRPGIHTEKHPISNWGGGWGGGKIAGDVRQGGIYMASTINNSCRAWDVHVEDTGPMGDCEDLRNWLEAGDDSTYMLKNELYWITDSCPHESLPIEPGTFRQWFRLVTNDVGLWYAKHSTTNSLGVKPACTVLYGDKFA